MSNDKFVFLVGFLSVKETPSHQKRDLFPEIDSHLKVLGSFAGAVNMYGVSITRKEKIDHEPKSHFEYQLMLIKHFKSLVTYYKNNKALLEALKVNERVGKCRECFFLGSNWRAGELTAVLVVCSRKGGKANWPPPPFWTRGTHKI